MATVAFIGLGNMGGPMAKNLMKAGHAVTVFDLVPEACADLENAGAIVADSAEAAVVGAEYVITMLPAGRHVRTTFLGDNGEGLLARLDTSTTVLDCSTIDAETAREVGVAAREVGIGFIRRCRGGGGGNPGLHVRGRGGYLREGKAGPAGHGQEHISRGARGCGPGRQGL